MRPEDAEGAILRVTGARYASIHRLNGALGPAVEIDLQLTGAPEPTAALDEEGL